MTDERKGCPMRHENGNCLPCSGFCLAVNDEICEALHQAYHRGFQIANGVMVKEPQKPLTEEEAKNFMLWHTDKPPLLWIEYKTNKEKNRYIYVETVNELYQFLQILSSYRNNVRCWIEKPTDEEREAAEWE